MMYLSNNRIVRALVLFFVVFMGLRVNADVTLRFWDNGVLVHTATETENAGSHFVDEYYDGSTFAGHLEECDGYTFAGWKANSPIINEAVNASDEAAGITDRVTVGTDDIDLYAVYKKSVTCFNRIYNVNSTDLVAGTNYLIVGKNGSSYYAMSNENLGASDSKYSGLTTSSVTPYGEKIYSVDASCVWNLSGSSNGNYILQNNSSTQKLYPYHMTSKDMYNYLAKDDSKKLTFAVDNGVWTIKNVESYTSGWSTYYYWHFVNFAIANDLGDLSGYSNIFTAGYYDTRTSTYYDNPTTAGDIYLYKQITESRYKCKCGPYTLRFKACGDNSCGDAVSLATTSLAESQTSTPGAALAQFSGVNPTLVSPEIKCSSQWNFVGWAVEPCVDQSLAEPTYITANPYALYHQEDTLYAVYRHKTHGTLDYWTSYPACDPLTVTFYPCNGLVNSSSAPYALTEVSAGAGVTVPAAEFTTCGSWTFAGWATSPCVDADEAPDGMLSSETTYYPTAPGEKFYAVYNESGRWTSYPVCAAATLTLYAGSGLVESASSVNKTEDPAGAGIVLPSATTSCSGVWSFVGWTTSAIGTVSEAPTLYLAASTFHPRSANDALYAVYRRGSNPYVYAYMPSCDQLEVILHACGSDDCEASSVNSKSIDTISEVSIGAGIEFPAATTECDNRWEFAGWNTTPIDHRYTLTDDLYQENDVYVPNRNYENFYAVYKHTTMDYWTSNPNCTAYTVHLHACEGTLPGGVANNDSTEDPAGSGILLPAVTPLCSSRGWSFLGWVEGGDLSTTQDISDLTILNEGSRYKPIRDNVHLYAVYSITGYKQVTNSSELVAGDEYVIAFYWNYGNDFSYENFALSNQNHTTKTTYLSLIPIGTYLDAVGDKYVTQPANSCKWQLGGSEGSGWTFRSLDDNKYVSSNKNAENINKGNSSTSFNINLEAGTIERTSYSASYRYWHFTQVNNCESFYAYQSSNPDKCYLYHRIGTVYSSWPHCAEYTVYFDGCDGLSESAFATEEDAGKGVAVPDVTPMCAGWTFAGWAKSTYNEKTGTLTKNLYPANSTYVPEKDNETLYAVYAQVKDTFEQVSGMSDLYTGVNYMIVWNSSRAMGNVYYDNTNEWGLNALDISSSLSANKIINSTASLKWQLQGYANNYIWYNVNANKYLDFSHTHYDPSLGGNYYAASLTDGQDDHFAISYISSDGGYFMIVSLSIPNNRTRLKYVGDESSNQYFDAYSYSPENTNIKLYRQKADYWSYPCSKHVEPMRWGEGSITVESLTLSGAPTSGSAFISSIVAGENDTYVISHSAKPGSRLCIEWDGSHYQMTIPYIASPSYTPNVENLPQHNLVVLPNTQFTVGLNTHLHEVSVYEDAELIIADGDTLFVDTLILRSKGADYHPNIIFGGNTAAIIINSGVIYHDLRIDDKSYYPMCLPYTADASQIRYSGLISDDAIPVPTRGTYDEDYGDNYFWIKYYDGVLRAAHANAGNGMQRSYWRHIPNNTLNGGSGYSIGIADNVIGRHSERTLRFRMTPAADWNKYEDGTYNKAVAISPSKVNNVKLKNHSGWNWIGNPYLHTFYPGTLDASSGLFPGHFEEGENGGYSVAEDEAQTVPYFTFYDVSSDDYYQSRSNLVCIKPFSAVFVQVEDSDMLLYQNPLHAVENMPARVWRSASMEEENPIVTTGVLLAPADFNADKNGASFDYDETGLIISNRYNSEYEVGADLVKVANSKILHLYTMNDTYSFAFNALDEQSAAQPIPMGVNIPKDGTYTFRFDDNQYDPDEIEALWVTDYEQHQTVNLKDENYTFYITKGVNNSRFAINAVLPSHKITTDNETVPANGTQIRANEDGSITIYSNDKLLGLTVYDLAGRLIGSYTPNSYYWTLNMPQGVYAICIQSENGPDAHVKVCVK